jgi:hypothetical protein
MSIKGKSVLLAAGVLGAILAMPALAQHSGGGGGHGGGGGGHAFGGGGGHAAAPHVSGGRPGGGIHGYGGGPGHYASAYHGAPGVHAGYQGRPGAYVGGHYGGYGYHGYGYHGYSTGAHWGGGYWRGGYWPRAYYGLGYSWFLPILPLAYSTYWWGGVPYYYANDVYYTYDPNYQGYVATDPPPVADPNGSATAPSDSSAPTDGAQQLDSTQGAPQSGPSGPIDGAPAQIFMYPKNGQSADQQARDKAECQQWATEQAGSVAQNGSNFNRAMVACVEGRGYSAR